MTSTTGPLPARIRERLSSIAADTDAWRPILFRSREEVDRRALTGLLEDAERPLQIFDTIRLQLRDLIQSRHPARKLTAAELDSLTGEHLRGVAPDEYGVWAYYPWSRRLVHLSRCTGNVDFGIVRRFTALES